MAWKPKGSHRAYKEWATSVKLLEQDVIIVTLTSSEERGEKAVFVDYHFTRNCHNDALSDRPVVFFSLHLLYI